jgi:hypothetical protein
MECGPLFRVVDRSFVRNVTLEVSCLKRRDWNEGQPAVRAIVTIGTQRTCLQEKNQISISEWKADNDEIMKSRK